MLDVDLDDLFRGMICSPVHSDGRLEYLRCERCIVRAFLGKDL